MSICGSTMTDEITEAVERLTELTGIENKGQLENAVFSVYGGLYEVGVEEVTVAQKAGVKWFSGQEIIAEPNITLEGTPLDSTVGGEPMGKTHPLSRLVREIEDGAITFERVEE